ncbi:N-acetylgalactosamine-6-O-sulfatase [Rubritalea halochordaticola]|uniref:N-acetylgalactosamine-6-O-sulfatase n=1 Tax=Rubritalea halochordaticola TaxID=714537 RepID=A0ABP9V4M1_9BACT
MKLSLSKISTFILAVISAGLTSSYAQTKQPNIIYINTDDWGIGKVPSLEMDPASQSIIKTPNLDKLKADGMTFTNAYAGNAVCGPSRCTLLTGKHPGNAAWRANRKTLPSSVWPIDTPMLGEVARQAGYKTAAFGKLCHGGTSTPEEITATGWDYWMGFLGHIDCRDYYSSYIWENGKKITLPANAPELLKGTSTLEKPEGSGVVGMGKGTFIEELYADKICEFMTENKEEPFFIYFASVVPHGGPPGGMRVPDLLDYKDNPKLTKYEKLYCALLTWHDRSLGKIRAKLDELGIADNTIIIWTSDNGDENSYYRRTKTFDGNGPFRAMKRSLYEGGIRAPMIAVWPDKIKPGSSSELITTQVDVMPTVAEAGGNHVTKEMDGISIFPTLAGEPNKQTNRDYIYFEFYETARQQSVRMGKWKGYRRDGLKGETELYNLDTDIGETKDLAAKHPDIVKKIEEIMAKEHTSHPVWKLPGLDK